MCTVARGIAVLVCALGLFGALHAEPVALDAEQERRYARLANELRCLVCQNQSIAESNAPLAQDLKQRVRQQIRDGRSDDEIRAYMRERYGDFVLYKPPLNAVTAALWASPVILLAFGGLWLALRMRRARPEDDEDEEDSDAPEDPPR